jgi:hypothetical protein
MQKDVIKNIDIKQLKIKTHFFERKNGTFQLLSVEYIILNDQLRHVMQHVLMTCPNTNRYRALNNLGKQRLSSCGFS